MKGTNEKSFRKMDARYEQVRSFDLASKTMEMPSDKSDL